MLRYVAETVATIWVETDEPCMVEVLGRTAPTFCVGAHHFALVIIEGLAPASTIEYDVRLDGEVRWPDATSTLPPSVIRTLGRRGPARMIFGSCRTAAPHEPPWTLQFELDATGRGVDALRTYALSMLECASNQWPELAIFLGDQVYADDSSPATRRRIAELRGETGDGDSIPPPELVGGYEQFTWLYHESWSPEVERWFFANVPSVMIFDDHDMIDDWNISDTWIAEIKKKPWWPDHVAGGLMTYWLYQHLGNLGPETIRAEGMLDRLAGLTDGLDTLREWAEETDLGRASAGRGGHHSGGYRFSFVRDIGRVRLVMIDSRNARALQPKQRRMVDAESWNWVVDACRADVDHLLIGTSLPVFVPAGLHDLQVWSEAVCDGSWGRVGRRVGKWLRVTADMEDWAAFVHSFDDMVELLGAIADPPEGTPAPVTISVLSGDIHFSYAAEVQFQHGRSSKDRQLAGRVHQLVSSPIRNALRPPESTAMRLGASAVARVLGRVLRRAVLRPPPQLTWKIDLGPVFANSVGELTFDDRSASLLVLQVRPHDETQAPAFDRGFELDLVAGSRATALEGGGAGTSSGRRPRRPRTRSRRRRR
ncbi:MAG TPA: hypothetical protein VLD86_11870 [Ilumatobacteraceae bacterium]|nr:hypothetical protein [Ilumatobacteraceae bacterium]